MRRLLSRPAAVVLTLVCAMLLSGCLSMPTSGPVRETGKVAVSAGDEGFEFDPRPPTPGATPADIVTGFLDAMQATPVQTTTARLFLTKDVASSWDPQQETITYGDKTPPRGTNPVTVDLVDTHHLDAQGSWQGPLREGRRTLQFRLTRQDGEWRISSAPNALIVPESWFELRFARMSLYFFDPAGHILVPEPVFVPRGQQLATALVRGLIRGPGHALQGVVRSYLPTGVSEGLSVPVSRRGVARVDLSGDVGDQTRHDVELMAAQLAWTLRQVSTIERVRLSIGGQPAVVSDSSDFQVDGFAQYDPAGYAANEHLWGLRNGALVTNTEGEFVKVAGEWGRPQPVRSVAVDLEARWAAGVTDDGRSVLIGGLDEGSRVRQTDITGTNLQQPAWDHAGRLWLLDRTADGARLSYLQDGTVTPVRVPGVTGTDIRAFLVSRDGTRFIAVRRGPVSDEIVVSRLLSDAHGHVTRGSRARTISDPDEGAIRIRDLAWHSTTDVIALQQLPETAVVRILGVDGDTSGAAAVTLTVGDRLWSLVGSPVTDSGLYAVTRTRLLDLSGRGENLPTDGVTALTYAG